LNIKLKNMILNDMDEDDTGGGTATPPESTEEADGEAM
jgi:hypothetical protein